VSVGQELVVFGDEDLESLFGEFPIEMDDHLSTLYELEKTLSANSFGIIKYT